ncbi:hypothetical protein B0H14DRAFT_853844 [Mycena olivaceomarginata]|nr:hypothetical protein B0H14DRAFT_853844 [Mycena olivaceomarginata]
MAVRAAGRVYCPSGPRTAIWAGSSSWVCGYAAKRRTRRRAPRTASGGCWRSTCSHRACPRWLPSSAVPFRAYARPPTPRLRCRSRPACPRRLDPRGANAAPDSTSHLSPIDGVYTWSPLREDFSATRHPKLDVSPRASHRAPAYGTPLCRWYRSRAASMPRWTQRPIRAQSAARRHPAGVCDLTPLRTRCRHRRAWAVRKHPARVQPQLQHAGLVRGSSTTRMSCPLRRLFALRLCGRRAARLRTKRNRPVGRCARDLGSCRMPVPTAGRLALTHWGVSVLPKIRSPRHGSGQQRIMWIPRELAFGASLVGVS